MFVCLETASHCVALADLKLRDLRLLLPPECWGLKVWAFTGLIMCLAVIMTGEMGCPTWAWAGPGRIQIWSLEVESMPATEPRQARGLANVLQMFGSSCQLLRSVRAWESPGHTQGSGDGDIMVFRVSPGQGPLRIPLAPEVEKHSGGLRRRILSSGPAWASVRLSPKKRQGWGLGEMA